MALLLWSAPETQAVSYFKNFNMESIIGINFTFPSNNDDYLRLDGYGSLSEVDIAVIYLSFEGCNYETDLSNSTHNGIRLLNHKSSNDVLSHFEHWKRELKNYLQSGKTIVLLLAQKENLFIHTGQKEFSGTGRNQKVVNVVTEVNNYMFLPFPLSVYPAEGNKINPFNSLVYDFYEQNKSILRYEAYITGDNFQPLFISKNKDKTLGCHLKVLNGDVIILPQMDIDYEYYVRQDGSWNVKGLKFGQNLKEQIFELTKSIKVNNNKTPTPKWVESNIYELKSAIEIKHKILTLNKEIQKLTDEKQKCEKALIEEQKLKDLLFESGKPLEVAVINALKILGYSAENYNDGKLELDQVIVSPEGHRFIGECEGKENKPIDITKFRQLIDNLNEDFERADVKDKALGLLFGNPQRLLVPQKRNLDFTTKCINGAKRERIGLIKTVELFDIVKYLSENDNEEFKKKCREEIFKQLGGVIQFPLISDAS